MGWRAVCEDSHATLPRAVRAGRFRRASSSPQAFFFPKREFQSLVEFCEGAHVPLLERIELLGRQDYHFI
jgi:hypothetical protein